MMLALKELTETVTELPRGGYLVQTSAGYFQLGAPPETIKDTMLLPDSVPQVFILPRKLFNAEKGISLAELEFPIYYNFFILKRKTHIVCTRAQASRLLRVLREPIFGPEHVDTTQDVQPGTRGVLAPDLKAEMDYYKFFGFEDLLSFTYFKEGRCKFDDVTVAMGAQGFEIHDQGKRLARLPLTVEYKPHFDIGQRLPEPYVPPLYGVTCLGPSHGFDPTENTSGYIVWLNHRGIMIDPPVNSTEWLEDSNVNPKLIDSIILTHCHADHDAGTFQKIMEEGRITIYTTMTVMNSFLRKYSALSEESIPYLRQLFHFEPVYLERPYFIHGGEFRFLYRLHPIPTIGFTLDFQGKTFVYSSDHQAEPRVHDELLETKRITRERYEQLGNFPWDADVIYHESGIPPLHTAISWLDSLPEEHKKKTVVYHIAKKDFPEKTSLTLATFGIENTLYFEARAPRFEKTYEILGILKHLDFFQSFPLEKVQQFIISIEEEHFAKGETIISKGDKGEKFYIIYTGNVSIDLEGLPQKKLVSTYEYFGELALLTDQPVYATVAAETDVVAYSMSKGKFLSFIAGTDFEQTLKKLIDTRNEETWSILSTSQFFRQLTSYQKTWLQSCLNEVPDGEGGVLVREGEPFRRMYIVRDGKVEVTQNGKAVASLGRGDFVGDLHGINQNLPSRYTFKTASGTRLFAIEREDMRTFADNNPGLIMKLTYDF
jgi:CRP-like cAMP-binding protein/phosphoribosyl 1,2-cyclic phosphodiesterase